ncbi:MAG: lipopolysaccharide transport periplasmic protein LptA [Chitinophagaceae bacterium]|nr:lipopolysaccharide transport periplasmic protein LptA [Polaromonas sp.]
MTSFISIWLTSIALLAALATATLPVHAENADRDKPMNAEADALRYDDLKQTSVFTGNVVITKGTTIIRGEQVDVRQDAEGYQQATVVAAPGKLAFYRKKREGVDEFIEGEGERIDYDSRADVVTFIRSAVLRRYKGAVLGDETTGSQINYDNKTDVFTVDGGAQNRSASNPSGRVRALLSPRTNTPASAPLKAPTPPANLRPSTTLGADKK